MSRLRLAYYADDFTGATDALEVLTLAGTRTVLFTSAPTQAELAARFSDLEAIGVASVARTMSPEEMDVDVRLAFGLLRQLDPAVVHYKVCSTFDSSPGVGSIGHVADIGLEIFNSPFAPVVVGAPALGRYVVFGNLFASDGLSIERLDRHTTMRDHPVTPMAEADLRIHLAAQTQRTIGTIDIATLSAGPIAVHRRLEELVHSGTELVVLDTLTDEDLAVVGRTIWDAVSPSGSQFVIGSSGVEHSLVSRWRAIDESPESAEPTLPTRPVEQIIVLSASAASNTEKQIRWAEAAGWRTIAIDSAGLLDEDSMVEVTERTINEAGEAYKAAESVILFTALGPHDPSLATTREGAAELGYEPADIGNELGRRLGQLLERLIHELRPQRICVAGGDTSGHVVAQLHITAMEMISTTVPGAPLCRAMSTDPAVDGLELVLKGGQTGPPQFFEVVRTGSRD